MVRTGGCCLGKIHKMVSTQTDNTHIYIYIGSTCKRLLSSRFVQHRTGYKQRWRGNCEHVRSFEMLAIDAAPIVFIENFPCKDTCELEARERYHIESNACVNKMIPARSLQDWRALHKEERRELLGVTARRMRTRSQTQKKNNGLCNIGSMRVDN